MLRTSVGWNKKLSLIKNERLIISLVIFIVVVVAIFDLFEDYDQGSSRWAIFGDILFISVTVFILAALWRITPLSLIRRNTKLVHQISTTNEEAARWQQQASNLMQGLGEMINKQFDFWKLSQAEQQVALLLLKGLSHKEIAHIRNTKSRTVRQQAASIYRKANLSNRAELSAFFLEDLF